MTPLSNAQLKPLPAATLSEPEEVLREDPRWQLAQEIVAGPHLARSALLSKFLLYIVRETLEGRQQAIGEHKIGVIVFGRPPNYRTDEDNIVRNYARQLRRRLADHFATVGKNAPLRIDVPVGGYIPLFTSAPAHPLAERGGLRVEPGIAATQTPLAAPAKPSVWGHPAWSIHRALLIVMVFAALGLVSAAAYKFFAQRSLRDPQRVFWRNVMPVSRTTYIVPADAGFNLLEDISHSTVPLAEYIKGAYGTMPTDAVDQHTSQDLRLQQYTDFVSLETISKLARLPEYDPQRVQARFPRDLRLNDLKNANAIIIGSSSSNPWASLADASTNFGIATRQDMAGAQIVNRHPLPGESPSYASNWNEPAHETFALILYQPNLSETGNLLLIEGLDVAGTQGAAEVLFRTDLIVPVLYRAERPDGTLRPFEILLRTTSIQSSAEGTQIVAVRIGLT